MVAVDQLISTLKNVTTNRAAASSASERKTSLNRQAERVAILAQAVRLQSTTSVVRSAEDGDSKSGGGVGVKKTSASCFCWSDGVLVGAMERGDWLLLDGANLCSSR